MLARALARPSNVLVLDEPTNDLDLDTLDLLQEMLAAYPGTQLLDSHDRDFLDLVVNAVIAAEGEGRWIEYAGGYSDMLAQRGAPAVVAGQPKDRGRVRSAPTRPVPSTAGDGPATPKRKLSFAEQHALKTLPVRIEKLSAEVARLEEILAAPDLYRKDPTTFTKTTMALAMARGELGEAEEQWLAAEMRREEVEGR
jgi:ATP-binding cassette subfamily F protein uup